MKIVSDDTWNTQLACIARLSRDNKDLRDQLLTQKSIVDKLRADWSGHDCQFDADRALLRELQDAKAHAVALEDRVQEQRQRIDYLSREVERLFNEVMRHGA